MSNAINTSELTEKIVSKVRELLHSNKKYSDILNADPVILKSEKEDGTTTIDKISFYGFGFIAVYPNRIVFMPDMVDSDAKKVLAKYDSWDELLNMQPVAV